MIPTTAFFRHPVRTALITAALVLAATTAHAQFSDFLQVSSFSEIDPATGDRILYGQKTLNEGSEPSVNITVSRIGASAIFLPIGRTIHIFLLEPTSGSDLGGDAMSSFSDLIEVEYMAGTHNLETLISVTLYSDPLPNPLPPVTPGAENTKMIPEIGSEQDITALAFPVFTQNHVDPPLEIKVISATAVPEPSSYALLLAGLAFTGFAGKRFKV